MMKNKVLLSGVFLFLFLSCTYGQDLLAASRTNDIPAIEKIISQNPAHVNIQDTKGFTPLIIATYNNNEEAVRLLLKKGADPNIQDYSGNTALMGVAFKGYLSIVNLLIEYKAGINIENKNGATALMFAATFGHKEIVDVLLKNDADRFHSDCWGKSAIDQARIQENEEIIKMLDN